MPLLIVLVDLAFSFFPGLFVRAVAKRLVLESPHMQIQTDASCGLISSGPWADLVTLRILTAIQIEVLCKSFSVWGCYT